MLFYLIFRNIHYLDQWSFFWLLEFQNKKPFMPNIVCRIGGKLAFLEIGNPYEEVLVSEGTQFMVVDDGDYLA
jgi:hypothetical protein